MDLATSCISESLTDNESLGRYDAQLANLSKVISVKKSQTPETIKCSTEDDIECNNQSQTLNSCRSPSDIDKFTNFSNYYKKPLVKMQTIKNYSDYEPKESNSSTN